MTEKGTVGEGNRKNDADAKGGAMTEQDRSFLCWFLRFTSILEEAVASAGMEEEEGQKPPQEGEDDK